ncbi:Tim10/DDP family zinc finger-domain-containing protein [Tuber borchii]|uniref:Mitochondrial import inner membrane translocase subunit n=1 Tax=Tuber borchii TaxID=42251 RepID=A0A2T6ZYI3_TUBBO|nr:Tim10/DDP family zinc finger-domain-containing protein [Tuber borchii]
MDTSSIPDYSVSDFSDKDKKDLQTFIENEQQKAKFQANVHSLTDLCWTKCITGKISSTTIDRSEESCLVNCVNRFIDSQKAIVGQLDVMGGRT